MGVARMFKVLFSALACFFGLSLGKNLNVTLTDNPLLTCYTNPCVNVDGVGKILGTTKVGYLNLGKKYIYFFLI